MMMVPFILLLLPEGSLSIKQNQTSSLSNKPAVIEFYSPLRVDLGLVSSLLHAKDKLWLDGQLGSSTGFYYIFPQIRKWSGKKGPSRSEKSQGISF